MKIYEGSIPVHRIGCRMTCEDNEFAPLRPSSFSIWSTNQERGTRNLDEEFFMIYSWTHHVVELDCQQ